MLFCVSVLHNIQRFVVHSGLDFLICQYCVPAILVLYNYAPVAGYSATWNFQHTSFYG